jgi:ketosteroid isomerase-like protein
MLRGMTSPRDVLEQLIEGVPARRWAELPDLYHEDAVVEQPMALPRPVRLTGRRELAEHFAAASRLPLEMRAVDVVVRETTDPAIVVGEFAYDCLNEVTGRRFRVPNVFVVEVRDGLIVRSRDYTQHALFAWAFGRLDAVARRI